jgi:hypothetical protein
MAEFLHKDKGRVSHNSQYVLSVFEAGDRSEYEALIDLLKAGGYSTVRILQIWLRGEILYYAMADGVVLRPEHQRAVRPKEEADLIRKIYKTVGKLSRPVDFTRPDIYSGTDRR